MIPERIGTIGKMQGVNPNRIPPPKKVATISQKLPERKSLAASALSDFGSTRLAAGLALSACAGGAEAAVGSLRVAAACAGGAGDASGFHAASVRSKLFLLGG
jgi:hypothetical protein